MSALISSFDIEQVNYPLKSMITPFLSMDISEIMPQFGSLLSEKYVSQLCNGNGDIGLMEATKA